MLNTATQDMDNTNGNFPSSKRIWLAIIILAILFAGTIGIYVWNFGTSISTDQSLWGQFGDYLGGVINPAVGFITIILLIITLNTQREELAQQREETRRSADALDAQYKAIQIQSFEQTLFKWFDNYRSLIEDVEYTYTKLSSSDISDPKRDSLTGRKAIRRIVSNASKPPNSIIQKLNQKTSFMVSNLSQIEIDKAYEEMKEEINRILRSERLNVTTPIRTLYGIFKWISLNETPGLDRERKIIYASIIRAQLSETELRLLFINGIGTRGTKFAKYANQFALFDNMTSLDNPMVNLVLSATDCPYTRDAFGDQSPKVFDKKPRQYKSHGKSK